MADQARNTAIPPIYGVGAYEGLYDGDNETLASVGIVQVLLKGEDEHARLLLPAKTLSSIAPAFEAMFSHEMREKINMQLVLDDFCPEGFAAFVGYAQSVGHGPQVDIQALLSGGVQDDTSVKAKAWPEDYLVYHPSHVAICLPLEHFSDLVKIAIKYGAGNVLCGIVRELAEAPALAPIRMGKQITDEADDVYKALQCVAVADACVFEAYGKSFDWPDNICKALLRCKDLTGLTSSFSSHSLAHVLKSLPWKRAPGSNSNYF